MAVSVSVTSTNHLLHHLIRPQPPSTSPSLSLLLRPLCVSSTANTTTPIQSKLKNSRKPLFAHKNFTHFTSLSNFSLFSLSTRKNLIFCQSLSTSSSLLSTQANPIDDDEESDDDEEELDDIDEDELVEAKSEVRIEKSQILSLKRGEILPDLTVKEKKELASYANSLGKKLKSQLVGKSGVTQNVATSFVENLESNELLKIKIHRTCPGELDDVVSRLEELTGSVVVGKIGRTVILYRPSITKLKAEEKKKENMKLFMSRRSSKPFVPKGQERKPFKTFSLNKGQERKPFRRGGRGMSRV